jgi:hypothetical protein
VPGDGCWAGRCACPWPRLCLLVLWQSRSRNDLAVRVRTATLVKLFTNRRGPGSTRSQPCRHVWATVRGY